MKLLRCLLVLCLVFPQNVVVGRTTLSKVDLSQQALILRPSTFRHSYDTSPSIGSLYRRYVTQFHVAEAPIPEDDKNTVENILKRENNVGQEILLRKSGLKFLGDFNATTKANLNSILYGRSSIPGPVRVVLTPDNWDNTSRAYPWILYFSHDTVFPHAKNPKNLELAPVLVIPGRFMPAALRGTRMARAELEHELAHLRRGIVPDSLETYWEEEVQALVLGDLKYWFFQTLPGTIFFGQSFANALSKWAGQEHLSYATAMTRALQEAWRYPLWWMWSSSQHAVHRVLENYVRQTLPNSVVYGFLNQKVQEHTNNQDWILDSGSEEYSRQDNRTRRRRRGAGHHSEAGSQHLRMAA